MPESKMTLASSRTPTGQSWLDNFATGIEVSPTASCRKGGSITFTPARRAGITASLNVIKQQPKAKQCHDNEVHVKRYEQSIGHSKDRPN